jgi:RNA polymerase sigma-70 factor (ECF subfamily)
MTDFSALYQKHAPEVFRFALYLSGNRGEAEDITSETFVRAWTSSAHIEMATLRGYLFTIARNLFLQGRRKSSRHDAIDEALPDHRPGPHALAEQRTSLDAVIARLQKLPEVDRAALLMRALGRLGLWGDRARTRYFRSRRRRSKYIERGSPSPEEKHHDERDKRSHFGFDASLPVGRPAPPHAAWWRNICSPGPRLRVQFSRVSGRSAGSTATDLELRTLHRRTRGLLGNSAGSSEQPCCLLCCPSPATSELKTAASRSALLWNGAPGARDALLILQARLLDGVIT